MTLTEDEQINLVCPVCHENQIIGIELRGQYDGVLVWRCAKCEHQWPRFASGRWHDVAAKWINENTP